MFEINSFRHRLLILFAGLAFVLGLSITLYIGHIASAQMTKASGQTLYLSAKSIAHTFANSLNEREREIVLLAQSPFFMDAAWDDPALQLKLDQVHDSYSYYAWLGIATPQGQVALAAEQLLQGADVSSRPWFQAALKQVYLGDVHEAVLLAKKIKALNPHEPMRFIDFAAPIYDRQQQLKGVLAAHADWSWASDAIQSALPEQAQERGIEVFIVNAKGEILYPFKSIGQVKPPAFQANQSAFFKHNWHEHEEYLSIDIPIVSDTAMDLGWHVMMRQPMSLALADVRALQQQIFFIGLFISALMLWFTYRLANRFSQPIEQLAQAAKQVEQGQVGVSFEPRSSLQEIQALAQSLSAMTANLLLQKQQLLDANSSLEQKVQVRTQALALANAELQQLARHDGLTGLYNRRAFDEYIDYLFLQFKRTEQAYAVLLLDVDYFKKVNDEFGHETGDLVLKNVAQVLNENIRESDFLARFGGEEFIIVAPQSDLNGAMLLAEKIRMSIKEQDMGIGYAVTVSIGLSMANVRDQNVQAAIRRADAGLYSAKQQGRNQVIGDVLDERL